MHASPPSSTDTNNYLPWLPPLYQRTHCLKSSWAIFYYSPHIPASPCSVPRRTLLTKIDFYFPIPCNYLCIKIVIIIYRNYYYLTKNSTPYDRTGTKKPFPCKMTVIILFQIILRLQLGFLIVCISIQSKVLNNYWLLSNITIK